MVTRLLSFLFCVCCLANAMPLRANYLLVLDQQGVAPNRVVMYASTLVRDESPLTLDVSNIERIKQVKLTMIFEAVDRPFWTETRLDIRCPSVSYDLRRGRRLSPPEGAPVPAPATVMFRMHGGSSRQKDSPDVTPLSPADWQSSTSESMKRAFLLACNAKWVSDAADGSFGEDDQFDPTAFRSRMTPIGLGDAPLISGGLYMSMLAEFTWMKLWADTKMPPINNGRDLTPEEIAEMRRKIEESQRSLETQKAAAMASLQAMDQEFKFRDEAARLRGNRKMSRTESQMLMAWQDKGERDVVVAMGAPQVSEAGGIRFLAYGQDYDSRYVVQRVVSGHTWVEGVYNSCNIQFVLIPDAQGQFRVADVVVTAYRSGDGWAPNLCDELTEAPRG